MIIVTGAYGFIGTYLINELRDMYPNIVAVDDFERSRYHNLLILQGVQKVDRAIFFEWVKGKESDIDYILHLGARTDTTESNEQILSILNLEYSKNIWNLCADYNIPLIYASSAATYGDGSYGYDDNHALIPRLEPMNLYGWSKQDFDIWTFGQVNRPPHFYGLKFFNVYGPYEYHKGRMASVIFHAYNQINSTGKMKLFKSHKTHIPHGHQSRDFIYVKDVTSVIKWFMESDHIISGIYNVGTGIARSFLDLTKATFEAMNIPINIKYIDTPLEIRDSYQYYTEAKMSKLLDQGYYKNFCTLEDGVRDYVQNYLMKYEPK